MTNHVEVILKRSLEIHLKKREDYTSDSHADPFENFTRSNEIASWFPDSYKSFTILIGTKLARLGALLITGKKPNNEGIEDTFLDLITYCALMYGFWMENQNLKIDTHRSGCKLHKYYVDGCSSCIVVQQSLLRNSKD